MNPLVQNVSKQAAVLPSAHLVRSSMSNNITADFGVHTVPRAGDAGEPDDFNPADVVNSFLTSRTTVPAGTTVLFAKIAGSAGYNLDLPDGVSDLDYVTVFGIPLEAALAFREPVASLNSAADAKPDCAAHEARQAVRLLIKGNPAMLELLHSKPSQTCVWGEAWEALRAIRTDLVTQKHIANYLGFLKGQMREIERGGGADKLPKAAKKLYHVHRLLFEVEHLCDPNIRGPVVWFPPGPERDYIMSIRLGQTAPQVAYEQAKAKIDKLETEKPWEGVLPKEVSVETEVALNGWLQKLRLRAFRN